MKQLERGVDRRCPHRQTAVAADAGGERDAERGERSAAAASVCVLRAVASLRAEQSESNPPPPARSCAAFHRTVPHCPSSLGALPCVSLRLAVGRPRPSSPAQNQKKKRSTIQQTAISMHAAVHPPPSTSRAAAMAIGAVSGGSNEFKERAKAFLPVFFFSFFTRLESLPVDSPRPSHCDPADDRAAARAERMLNSNWRAGWWGKCDAQP